ncbi:MAG: heavy metal translocating P-type ATPase [Anaerolineales bacterium]
MNETTLELEIPMLLPGIEDDRDGCLDRLEVALQGRKGILRSHLELDKSPVVLCLHYDPAIVSIEDVRRLAERAGAGIVNRYHHDRLPVEGMDCSDCALVLEHSLERMDGVLNASVSYAAQTLHVEYDSRHTSRRVIEKRVGQLGYRVPVEGVRNWYQDNRELLFSLLGGAFLLVGWLGEQFPGFPPLASLALYLAAYGVAGYDITRHALHALRERHFDTDLLMVLAALGAAALGEFVEGALLLFLFSLGHALEERALDRARDAIRALRDLAPKTALLRRDGSEVELSVEEVQIGDVVIVRPGERVPVDGEVLVGNSAVDQSPVTGESVPVDKVPGSPVFVGSVNGEGALEIQTSKLARDSTLARVMEMVERAQAQKSPTQQTTERFTRIFVPTVLVADLLLILIPPLLFGVPFADSFRRAMTLLVAASPCALALGTPSAILAGVAQAARNGVLVKGGAHLENLGRLRAIAFDKTGTMTEGKPRVTDILPLNGATPEQLLSLAAAVESRSAHPLAKAVVDAADARGLKLPPVDEAISVTGRGFKAEAEGKPIWIGNIKLFEEAGIELPREVLNPLEGLEDEGKTVMVVGLDGTPLGLIAVADVVREDAAVAVESLRSKGLAQMVMLTGDNSRVAAYIAGQVGLSDFEADLMPEDKLTAIDQLVAQHDVVAMVGDGVNDAPALANATVGIAMGGAGTDVALETADVALMADDLSRLPFSVGLGRASRAIIVQNLAISLGVIAVLITMALSGLAGIGIAILFHEGSTIVVALNALRLLTYRERK